MTNLDSILKSRDITLPTKVCLVKAMVFPVVMYGCESLALVEEFCDLSSWFKTPVLDLERAGSLQRVGPPGTDRGVLTVLCHPSTTVGLVDSSDA